MARFLISTMPGFSHIQQIGVIARALVARGHTVWWHTSATFQSAVEACGAHFTPASPAAISRLYADPGAARTAQETLAGRRPRLASLRADLQDLFIAPLLAQHDDYQALLPTIRPDALIADLMTLGPALFAETTGIPWAMVGMSTLSVASPDVGPFTFGLPPARTPLTRLAYGLMHRFFAQVLMRPVNRYTNTVRATLALPPLPHGQMFFDLQLSPYLYLQGTTPSFEYPRRQLPPQIHFVGPLIGGPTRPFAPPVWWPELATARTVVHVSQGTVATAPEALLLPTLHALADEPLLVVAVTGGAPVARLGDQLPANARVAPFLPYDALLPHTTVMVTNGGYGGVQLALAHGVPLVAAGKSEDKAEVCARIGWSGVGINLDTHRPTPAQIRGAVRQVLADGRYRRRAQALQQEFTGYDAGPAAAALLDQLAVTGRPVLRATTPHIPAALPLGAGREGVGDD